MLLLIQNLFIFENVASMLLPTLETICGIDFMPKQPHESGVLLT
jgi:hypothetical protein